MHAMNIPQHYIFWDWNGTLLDDTTVCITTMNGMLSRRDMPEISVEYYKEVFGFPVIEYYRKVGFDFKLESFEQLSVEFINSYNAAMSYAPIAKGAKEILDYFISAGKTNFVISAMQQEMLLRSVSEKGLSGYFTDILGIGDIFAAGKAERALLFVRLRKLHPDDMVLIGDTSHDFEVAKQIGCRCILIADGHESPERLKRTEAEVAETLNDLLPANLIKST
jgi:phosphoglycolate phosphatase